MTELEGYWKQYVGHIEGVSKWFENLKKWYGKQSGILQRFIKYGGWIFIQFWIIRAPMTVLFTGMFPEIVKLNLFIHVIQFPGYLLASFTSGTLLAIVGFLLSEKWIWKPRKEEVQEDEIQCNST